MNALPGTLLHELVAENMSPSQSLDLEKLEKKAEPQHAPFREHDAASPSQKPRRSLHTWLACLALALLIFAGGRTAVCKGPLIPKQEPSVSDAAVDDRRLGELRLEEATAAGKANAVGYSLAVEPAPVARRQTSPTSSAAAASPTVLECFQVAPPVLTPRGASYQATERDGSEVFLDAGNSASKEACTVLLMEHSFAWSYGMPFIGKLVYMYRSDT